MPLKKSMRKYSLTRLLAAGLIALLLSIPFISIAQTKTITGTVKDDKGAPMPGTSIVVKGQPGKGTTTDNQGLFKISAAPGEVLVISSQGFESIEKTVGDASDLQVELKQAVSNTEEIVVVGYATQKKVNLTGSVSSISGKKLEDRPVANISSSLAGLSAGVNVRQGSGRPGSDGASIQIRGQGTLSNNSPLVLVDGIIGSMDAVNPQDVESISILKDAASASIYGTLAANGVILINTKKGSKNKTTVTYSGMYSLTKPMNMPEFVTNYAEHMRLINEGYQNVSQPIQFPVSRIAEWDSASRIPNQLNAIGVPNSIAYPNTDWADALFDDRGLQNHNISVSGGSEKSSYLLSVGYLDNKGIMQNTGTKRFQLRANLESKINKYITVGTQTFASNQTFDVGNTTNAFNFLFQTTPGVVPYYDGRYGFPQAPEESSTANNVLAFLNGNGGDDETTRFNSTVYANFNIIKGLVLETRFNYQTRLDESNSHSNPTERWDFNRNELKSPLPSPSTLSTNYFYSRDYTATIDNVLRYNFDIGTDHTFAALAGYNQWYYNYQDMSATKQGLIDYTITTLSSALTPTVTTGNEVDRAMRSYFGRVNYAYRGKYLLEANIRRDGSSRFSPEARWGTFPSVSAGWRISEENFFNWSNNWLSSLKLRGSWGKLGNNASGNYDWQATYASRLYSFNNQQASGLAVGRFANPDLQWENTTTTNLGFDASFFRNKLFMEFDIYQRLTDGILTTPPIPLTVGTASAPVVNTAMVKNKGLELTMGYRGSIRDFTFNVSGNFAYNTNIVTKYRGKLIEGYVTDASGNKVYQSNLGQVAAGGNTRILEDHMINEYHLFALYRGTGTYFNTDGTVNINGGPKDGMIRTEKDVDWARAMVAAGYRLLPSNAVSKTGIWYGDYVYADLNGDGQYGNSFDRKFTGTSSLPKYLFGFSADASWKGFDFSMIWAGATGFQYFWNADSYNNNAVRQGFAFTKYVTENRYYYNEADPADPKNNINGSVARLRSNDNQSRAVASDAFLYNGSYIKLRNLQIGYTLPQAWSKKALISRARVFFSGENLLMITNYPGLDPEIGAGVSYPTMKQFSFGINVTF